MKTLLEHIRHLQERLNAAEARVADLEGALRPFAKARRIYGDKASHVPLAVEHFALAADMVTDDGGK